jgi:hypothetical protein
MAAAAIVALRAALALLLLSAAATSLADEMRLRIAWGGGAERTWRGMVSVGDGSLSDPQPLGMESDEPGSMWLAGNRPGRAVLVIQQRSPRSYDGVDVSISAPAGAKLLVRLSGADDPEHEAVVEVPLSGLSGEFINKDIDNRGNRLLVMRTPGDALRVRFSRDNLVFAPGETFKCELEPHGLPLPNGGTGRVKIQLLSGSKELWSQQHDVQTDRADPIPLEIPLPKAEGVYDVAVTAIHNPNWSQAVRKPLNWRRTIAERRVQLLVLEPRKLTNAHSPGEYTQVVEIDPANPRWYEKFNRLPQLQLPKARLPRLWKGPLGNDCLRSQRHALGDVAELKPNADSPDVSWEAYWLPIGQPGRPHILEIEYPSDVPQTLTVGILEPNAAGTLSPLVVNSSVENGANSGATNEPPRWLRHRVVFWPRTTTPMLLVSNGRDRMPAVYGKIRVLVDGPRLASRTPQRTAGDRRLLAAYLDRPLIAESFSASESLDPWSGRSLDDWTTFYEAGTRLVDYLNYAGYNGLMLAVLADGSTIYPSSLLQPTPRHDSGVLFASGQDPVRKDALEMLLQLFDREELQLIPMLEFAAPLPELETIRRAGGPNAEGLELIGAEGTSPGGAVPSQRGATPYYNVLDSRVQRAMLRVLHELAARYAKHPSFTGLALRLSPDGYAQLPGAEWALDDATMARFVQETGVQVPGTGTQRYARRAAFFAEEPQRRTWLEWRAAQLAKFHRRAYDELAAARPGCRLYLAGIGAMNGPEFDRQLRPALPRRTTIASTLLQTGIDARLYRDDQHRIGLLRCERVACEENLAARAADLEISQMPDVDLCFQSIEAAGSLFLHTPREVHIESFDRKSPFKQTYSSLLVQSTPSGEQNRRRFIHSLATLDARVMVDGGWTLPLGQEATVRELAAAYRALPAVRFEPVANGENAEGGQSTPFHYATHDGRTYLYAVNDAPFRATARVHVEATSACQIEELSGLRKIGPLQADSSEGYYWEVTLEPYDLVAVRLSEPNVQCSSPRVTWPESVEIALSQHIRRLGARAAALGNPSPLDSLGNPGFEAAGTNGEVPEWTVLGKNGVSAKLDRTEKHDGGQSVKMVSKGPVVCLVSKPLTAPATGRLTVSVWLRVADPARQPPLRLAIEGKLRGRDYYRYGPVGGSTQNGQPGDAIRSEWGQFLLPIGDLPLEGLSSLRVRLDMMGPGEVWVDDVQVFSLAFSRPELLELSKLITLADIKLQNGQIGDCVRMLDGYWPRFLEENVALPAGAIPVDTAAAEPPAEEEKPPERSGWLNRVKDMLPESLRF